MSCVNHLWYKLIHVVICTKSCSVVRTYSNRDMHAAMSWRTLNQVVVYIRYTFIYCCFMLLYIYLFSALFDLNIWLYISLYCHLLNCFILLIHFARTCTQFYCFVIYLLFCGYTLLTNPFGLPIHAAWNSWNVFSHHENFVSSGTFFSPLVFL